MNTESDARTGRAIKEYADAVPVPDGDVAAVLARAAPRVRRRGPGWLVPVAAAAAAVVAIGAVVWWLPSGDQRGTPPGDISVPVVRVNLDSSLPDRRLDWLPPEVTRPRTPPDRLPTDRGVGPGALTYVLEAQDIVPVLITADGARYRLPGTLAEPPPDGADQALLSPDGRWLLMRPGRVSVLRDLTTGTEHRVDGKYGDPAWSANGRWVVLTRDTAGAPPEDASLPQLVRVDLATGDTTPFEPLRGQAGPAMVLDDGRAVFGLETLKDRTVTGYRVAYVDPATGETVKTTTIDLAGGLADGEQAWFTAFRPGPDGTTGIAVVFDDDAGPGRPGEGKLTALVEFDLDKATAVRRYELPDQPSEIPAGWQLQALSTDGPLVTWSSGRDGGLVLIDPDTGTASRVCTLPGISGFLVRGATR